MGEADTRIETSTAQANIRDSLDTCQNQEQLYTLTNYLSEIATN